MTEKCCPALLRGGAQLERRRERTNRARNFDEVQEPRRAGGAAALRYYGAARRRPGPAARPDRRAGSVQKPVYTHGAAPVKPPARARRPAARLVDVDDVCEADARAGPAAGAAAATAQTIDRAALLAPKAPTQPSVLPSSRLLRAVAVLRGSAVTEETRRQAALAQIEDAAAELRRRRL